MHVTVFIHCSLEMVIDFLLEIYPSVSNRNSQQLVQVHVLLTETWFCCNNFYVRTYQFFQPDLYSATFHTYFLQLMLSSHASPTDVVIASIFGMAVSFFNQFYKSYVASLNLFYIYFYLCHTNTIENQFF